MNNQSGKDKQQIIDNLKARLCWYAYEASEEEFEGVGEQFFAYAKSSKKSPQKCSFHHSKNIYTILL